MTVYRKDLHIGHVVPVVDKEDLADGCVSTEKLEQKSVTLDKLSDEVLDELGLSRKSYIMHIDVDGHTTIDWGESIVVRCTLYMGNYPLDLDSSWVWSVERITNNQVEDRAWNNSLKALNFNGTIVLSFKADENDLGSERDAPFGTKFVFTVRKEGTQKAIRNILNI